MKAIIRTKAGKELSTMQVQEMKSPTFGPNQVKVKMFSSRINPVDIDLMKGMPFLKYKKPQIGGIDGSGMILEVGSQVKDFVTGEEVFFYRKFTDIGTWAEEIAVDAADCAPIPENIHLEEAGAITLPLLTAFDALLQLGSQSGEKILIHGGAGGVGFQAVQLALRMGLEVITTAGKRDFELLNHAGVKHIIDYRTQSFEEELKLGEVDYIFDTIGKDVLSKSIALKPKKVVSVHYIDPSKMSKTGIKLPGILKFLMKMMMNKFTKAARRNGVTVIGQVTGANGSLLKSAAQLVDEAPYMVKPYSTLTIADIEKRGLSLQDLGKVILFHDPKA